MGQKRAATPAQEQKKKKPLRGVVHFRQVMEPEVVDGGVA